MYKGIEVVNDNVMKKCAELCKVSLSNTDIGNPCCRRRETKPMGCLEGIFTAAV